MPANNLAGTTLGPRWVIFIACVFGGIILYQRTFNRFSQALVARKMLTAQEVAQIRARTEAYIAAFDAKDIDAIKAMLTDDIVLTDPAMHKEGKQAVSEAVLGIFATATQRLSFRARNIFVDATQQLRPVSVIEFVLEINGDRLAGTDVIFWEGDKIKELRAYLDLPKR
eukprot:tig00000655_g2849.t1